MTDRISEETRNEILSYFSYNNCDVYTTMYEKPGDFEVEFLRPGEREPVEDLPDGYDSPTQYVRDELSGTDDYEVIGSDRGGNWNIFVYLKDNRSTN